MTYAKPWLTIGDQLAKLSARGMQVSDEAKALDYLERNPATGLTQHHDWLSKHAGLIVRSRETFMTHSKDKYGLSVGDGWEQRAW